MKRWWLQVATCADSVSHVFPVLNDLMAYDRAQFRADLKAGATVALVSLPQGIGFALIAGLPPQMVIACLVVGGIAAALFNSSRHTVFGPTNTISILLAGSIYASATPGLSPAQIAILMGLLIGAIQLAAGLTRLGNLTQFISRAVIVGYTTGVAILIVTGQFGNFLGIEPLRGASFPGIVAHLTREVTHLTFHPASLGLGIVSLALMVVIRRLRPSWPDAMLVVLVITLAAYGLNVSAYGVKTVAHVGALTASLPSFGGPPLTADALQMIPGLMNACLAIAILGMLEAISIGKNLASQSGQTILPNQDLIAMGAGNMAASMFGAMPGSASFVRSALSLQSGGRTQVGGLIAGGITGAGLLTVLPLANHIPIPCLAAILMVVASRIINWRMIRVIMRCTTADAVVLGVTLAGTLLLNLDTAIYVGVATSLALFLRKASSPSLVEYVFNDHGHLSELSAAETRRNPAVSIVHVEGDLFFGAADLFQTEIRRLADNQQIRVFILRMKNARHLDATTVLALGQLVDHLQRQGRHLLISGIHGDVARVLKRSGLVHRIGIENIFPAESNPTMATRRALARAQALLDGAKVEVKLFYDKNVLEKSAAATGAAG